MCISSSVNSKIIEMIDGGYDWIVQEIQNRMQPHFTKRKITKLTNRDCRIFEKFYKLRRNMLGSRQSPSMYFEILGQIEVWTGAFIHSIQLGKKIDTTIFLTELIAQVSTVCESLKAPLLQMDIVEINYEAKIEPFVFNQGVTKDEDVKHLSSAIHYQYLENTWAIFVTFDEKHILSHQDRLNLICGINCCKPIYAEDYLRDLSRLEPPLQYYNKIETKNKLQKSFEKIINSLNNSCTDKDA